MSTALVERPKAKSVRRRGKPGIWPFDGTQLRSSTATVAAIPAELVAEQSQSPEEDGCPPCLPGGPGSQWMMPLLYQPAARLTTQLEKAETRQASLGDGEFGEEEEPEMVLSKEPVYWSEEVVVRLHWRLLEDIKDLTDPAVSLAHKLDLLGWIFTDPKFDAENVPFSFYSCVRVVGLSRLAAFGKLPYVGKVDVAELRDLLRNRIRKMLQHIFGIYPPEIRRLMAENPRLVVEQLRKDPEWLNKQMEKKVDSVQGDLFG